MNFDYLYTFTQSNLLEVPIYFLIYRRFLTFRQTLLIVTLANSCTHPFVFFGFMGSGWSYLTSVIIAEMFAVGGETGLHSFASKLSWQRPFFAALVANLFSWQVAPALTYLFFL